nr:transposase [Streptomyces arboris]
MVDEDLWALIEQLLPPWPDRSPGPRPVPDRLCLQGILFVLHNDIAWQLLPPRLMLRAMDDVRKASNAIGLGTALCCPAQRRRFALSWPANLGV